MRDEFKNNHLWSKRYLPHYNAEHKYQMITYRLADSIPQSASTKLGSPQASAGITQKSLETKKRILQEETLDKGYGSCLLKYPKVAMIVLENWHHYHGNKYDLISFVIMPNHVHILIKTYEGFTLGQIVWSWKSYVTKQVFKDQQLKESFRASLEKKLPYSQKKTAPESRKKFVKESTQKNISLWHREYWDRFIRDENHYKKAIDYIHNNPVKAGLVDEPGNWPYSSYSKLDKND